MANYWEPKIQPPHPSTVSDLSENAQKVLAAIERKWEENFIRNKPSLVGPLAGRNPVCNYNYRPTPNHHQQNYTARQCGGLPPPISPSVAYGSQSQTIYPQSQSYQDGIFNKPQQSRTGVGWQQHHPMFRRYNSPSQDSMMVMSNPRTSSITPRYGAAQMSPGPSSNFDNGQFVPLQLQVLPSEPRQAMFIPPRYGPAQVSPGSSSNFDNRQFVPLQPQALPCETHQTMFPRQRVPSSRVVPNDPWFSQGASQPPNESQSLLLSSQVAQKILQIKSPHRVESPEMEFGSDEEGQDWTQSLTQRINVLSQQTDNPKTPETSLRIDNTQEDVVEIIDVTDANDSQDNAMFSQQLESYSALEKEATDNTITDENLEVVFNDPIYSQEQTLIILSETSKSTSPVELQAVALDSPIKLTPPVLPLAKELKMTPKKTSNTEATFHMTSKDTCSSSKIQNQKSHDNIIKHKKQENTKNNDSKGLRLQMSKSKQKSHGNVSEARAKLIESVLQPKSQEKQTYHDERPAKETKRIIHAELKEDIAQSMGVKRKKKFQTPFLSQQSQSHGSNQNLQPKVQTPNKKESIKITTLKNEEIKKLRQQIQSKPPIEICITMMYKEGYCQLSKTSEDIKKSTSCSPNGLMLSVLNENDPVKFYLLPIDGNNEERSTFITEKSLVKNILLAPCRKVCFKSQELFVYLIHTFKFKYQEVSLQWIAIDPLIGCWLLNSDEPPIDFKQVMKQLELHKKQEQPSNLQIQTCKNLVFLSQAVETMYQKLVERELWRVFLDLESKITSVLAVMEMEGIPVEKKILKDIGSNLEAQIKKLQSKANKLMGCPVLLTSPQQLRRILYEQLKLDSKINIPLTLQGGGKSTSESVLKLLETLHPLPGLILEFRHLQKLNSTYIDGILQYVSEGKLFTTWEQIVAATGRIISRDPNVQAIPKQSVCLTGEGDTKKEIFLRSAFKCKDGHSFLAADFQHIELRLLAHFAQDPALSAMFEQTEHDVFQLLARQWLGLSTSRDVTYEEREKTKRVVYAVMYGAGIAKLEQVLQVDSEEARNILSTFTVKFPQIRNFSKKLIWKARDQGYVISVSGRRRQFPNITSSDMKLRSQSERQAVNFLIQGSAADVCKVAMLATEKAQHEHSPPLNARLLLQIHDELVWQVPDSQLEQFTGLVQKAMEGTRNHFKISLPLPVALGSGKTWADLQ